MYKDIGDYLTKEEKLNIVSKSHSIKSLEWKEVLPDENHDWINQRDKNYEQYKSIEDIFHKRAIGVSTNRDAWVYGFSKEKVQENTDYLVENYNSEVERFTSLNLNEQKKFKINNNPQFIKWSTGLRNRFKKGKKIELNSKEIELSMYRPFVKKYLYYDKQIIERPGQYKLLSKKENKTIVITGVGSSRDFSAMVTKYIPNLDMMEKGQGFPEILPSDSDGMFNISNSNVNEELCNELNISSDDAFCYVYAVLHSKEYRERYAHDLRKQLPRIPYFKNKSKFIEIGRKLIALHLNYEELEKYQDVTIKMKQNPSFRVEKMKHPKRNQIDTIIYNSDITIEDIPEKAYEYIVNGRPAVEWIIDQYRIKKDRNSGLIDDPNDYSTDQKYIFDLLLKIINLSIQSVDLINDLPSLEIIE